MKLKFLSLAFLLILVSSSVPLTAEAQSNHSLEWGVDVGDEFTYVMQRAYLADSSYAQVLAFDLPFAAVMAVGEKYTLRVTNLSSISSLINESSQMPESLCDLERTNDSTSVATDLLPFVIPIGDWDFVNQMTNITGLAGVTLIDTAEEWGTSGAGSFRAADGTVVSISIEIKYKKENGTLNYLRYRHSTLGTDLIDIIIVNWHPGMPTIVTAGLQTTTILIISIAAVIGLIVSILVYQGYRSKKSVAQKLGE